MKTRLLLRYLVMLCIIALAGVKCKKEDTKPAEPTTGKHSFFTRTDLGQGNIDITVNGDFAGTMTHYYTNGITCGSGDVTVEKKPGTYTWTATAASGKTWSGNFDITAGGCDKTELTNSSSSGSGQATFWTASDLGCGNIEVNCAGITKSITGYYSSGVPACGATYTATFDLAPGTYSYSAQCTGKTWNGSITVTAGGCAKMQLTGSPTPTGTTITILNPTFTPMDITINGQTQQAPAGGSAVFSGTAGSPASGNATTSGHTSSGAQLGLLLQWSINLTYPSTGNYNYTLNVGSNYFFLKMRNNNSSYNITKVYVNYGLADQTVDNLSIPNNGQLYNIGYYKAYSNSNVRAESGSVYWQWYSSNMSLPFTNNQSTTLTAN